MLRTGGGGVRIGGLEGGYVEDRRRRRENRWPRRRLCGVKIGGIATFKYFHREKSHRSIHFLTRPQLGDNGVI